MPKSSSKEVPSPASEAAVLSTPSQPASGTNMYLVSDSLELNSLEYLMAIILHEGAWTSHSK